MVERYLRQHCGSTLFGLCGVESKVLRVAVNVVVYEYKGNIKAGSSVARVTVFGCDTTSTVVV